jgi:hypothetical protein
MIAPPPPCIQALVFPDGSFVGRVYRRQSRLTTPSLSLPLPIFCQAGIRSVEGPTYADNRALPPVFRRSSF